MLRLHVHARVRICACRVSAHVSAFACVCVGVCMWDHTVVCFTPGGVSSESAGERLSCIPCHKAQSCVNL